MIADCINLYILEYDNGCRAASWDDVWTGPSREGCAADIAIRWRVELFATSPFCHTRRTSHPLLPLK
jgi:hypothetical protein